jgi:hypothetical protein
VEIKELLEAVRGHDAGAADVGLPEPEETGAPSQKMPYEGRSGRAQRFCCLPFPTIRVCAFASLERRARNLFRTLGRTIEGFPHRHAARP